MVIYIINYIINAAERDTRFYYKFLNQNLVTIDIISWSF